MHQILNDIALLLSTDEVRTERLTVGDEVENGLYYFTSSIWSTVPRLYDDIRSGFYYQYNKSPELPIILKYRSWIRSDKYGKPFVTRNVIWCNLLHPQLDA